MKRYTTIQWVEVRTRFLLLSHSRLSVVYKGVPLGYAEDKKS